MRILWIFLMVPALWSATIHTIAAPTAVAAAHRSGGGVAGGMEGNCLYGRLDERQQRWVPINPCRGV